MLHLQTKAEVKNHNMTYVSCIFAPFEILSFKLCLLSNFKSIKSIFMKLGTNILSDDMQRTMIIESNYSIYL